MPKQFTPWRKHWTPEAREAARQRALERWTPERKEEARTAAKIAYQDQLTKWKAANPEKAAAFDRALPRPSCCEVPMSPKWAGDDVGAWYCRKCGEKIVR